MSNIGVIGRARAGKDTVGKWLVDNRGYHRTGFADRLKEAALKVDPIVEVQGDGYEYRLVQAVHDWTWEHAKDRFPEVRRFLQQLGTSMRAVDEGIWVRPVLLDALDYNAASWRPVVVTDVRFPNEAASLKRAGFHLIYIERPDVPQLVHESEGALGADDADYVISNTGDLDHLRRQVEEIADRVYAAESRKHYARSL